MTPEAWKVLELRKFWTICPPLQYQCDSCHLTLTRGQAEQTCAMWEPIIEAFTTFQSTRPEETIGLIAQLENTFHPHHSIILDLKLNIANKLCRDDKSLMDTASSAELEKKTEVCEDILSVLDIVYPGLSKYRGLLLHELSETILIRASKLFNMEKLSKEKFLTDLEKVSGLLSEGICCLEHDRKGSSESEVCSNMKKMQVTIEDFKKFINFL